MKEEIIHRWAGKQGDKILIKLKYSQPQAKRRAISILQKLDKVMWHKTSNSWTAELSVSNIEILTMANFVIAPGLKHQSYLLLGAYNRPEDDLVIPIKGELFPFQKTGVAWIQSRHFRALIADDMGLGKTIEALACMALKDSWPALVVCPATAKFVWEIEARAWIPHVGVVTLSGQNPNRKIEPTGKCLYIINYEVLKYWIPIIKRWKIKMLVIDESHYIKNRKTQRTRAVSYLAKRSPGFLALSGTPIINNPLEFYSTIRMIAPKMFATFWDYAELYCDPVLGDYGWDFTGASNIGKLNKLLTSTIMLRRTKKEALPDLPTKTRTVIPLECDLTEYNAAQRNFLGWMKREQGEELAETASRAEYLVKVINLRLLAGYAKFDQIVSWIDDHFMAEKLVVFSTSVEINQRLYKHYKTVAVHMDGSTKKNTIGGLVNKFQTTESIRLFLGTIKSAGKVITLTASSNVVFTGLPDTPAEIDQAEDRVLRIGQANAVNIWFLVAMNTLEEAEIADRLDTKRKIIDGAVDGKQTKQKHLLAYMIKKGKEDNKED